MEILEPYHLFGLLFGDQSWGLVDFWHNLWLFCHQVADSRGAGKTFCRNARQVWFMKQCHLAQGWCHLLGEDYPSNQLLTFRVEKLKKVDLEGWDCFNVLAIADGSLRLSVRGHHHTCHIPVFRYIHNFKLRKKNDQSCISLEPLRHLGRL